MLQNVPMAFNEFAEFRFLRRTPSQSRGTKCILDILHACEALLGEKQESEITIDEIADRANVQVGSVYFFFEDKFHIFFCLIDLSLREVEQQFNFSAEQMKMPLTPFLLLLEKRLAQVWEERKRMLNLYYAYRSHPNVRPTVKQIELEIEKVMSRKLEQVFPALSVKRRNLLALTINSHLMMGLNVAADLPKERVAPFLGEWRKVLHKYFRDMDA
jgi:AcrR family transcriptional regulator